MSFHWQTEDESPWEEPPIAGTRRLPRWQGLLPFVVLLVALALGAWAVIREVQGRVDQRRAEIEQDVAMTASLLHLAAAHQDGELFMTMLSGRDLAWTEAQKTLVNGGSWLDRSALGLQRIDGSEFEIVGTRSDADLLQVVVTGTVTYSATAPVGGPVPVRLEREEVYRLGPDRWLFAPPDEEYWGAVHVSRGSALEVKYPARDDAIVTRLAFDLERLVDQFCAGAGARENAGCEDLLPVELALATTASSLVDLLQSGDEPLSHDPFTLPTPTLIGLPRDEPSYQALLRGYGRQILGNLVAELVGLPCCGQGTFEQLLVDQVLYEYDIVEEPDQTATAQLLLQEQTGLVDVVRRVSGLWGGDGAGGDEADLEAGRLLIGFVIARDPGWEPLDLLALAGRSDGLRPWLWEALPDYPTSRADGPRGAWQRFLFEAAGASGAGEPGAPPVPLPAALQLVCAETDGRAIYRYELASKQILREVSQLPIAQALPAPDGQGLLIVVEGGTLLHWNGSRLRQLFDDPATDDLFVIDLDPLERYVALVKIQMRAEEPTTFMLLPLEECVDERAEGRCEPLPLAGLPFWSPAGTRSVVLELTGDATLADAKAQPVRTLAPRPLNLFAAAWLDEETLVLSHNPEEEILPDLIALDVAARSTQTLAEGGSLAALLPAEARVTGSYLQYMAYAPAVPDRLMVAIVSSGVTSLISLFSVELDDGSVTLVWSGEGNFTGFPGIAASADGRWLALPIRHARQDGGEVQLVNVAQAETRAFPVNGAPNGTLATWDRDGRWLAIADGFTVRLVAPDHDYTQTVAPGLDNCEVVRVID